MVFEGSRDDYAILQIDATTVQITAADGSADTIANVESFAFADLTQSFDELLLPREPNLAASGLSLDDISLAPGEIATATWTISSDGDVDAGASAARILIATAPDAGSVIGEAGAQSLGMLATGTGTQVQATLDLSGLAPGTYYVAAEADSTDVLAESDEGDNLTNWVQVVVEEPVPNLAASGLMVDDASLAPGEVATATYTVASDGTGDAGATETTILIATAPDEGSVIGSTQAQTLAALATGDTTQGQIAVDLSGLAPGTYYIAAEVDSGGALAETNETDNVSNWVAIAVEAAEPDMALTGVTVDPGSDFNLTGGATLDLSHDVSSLGNVGYYATITTVLSHDGTLSADDLVIAQVGTALLAGESGMFYAQGMVPEGFAVGDYTLISTITWDGPETETNLANNTFVSPQTVTLGGGTVTGTAGDDLVTGDGFDQTFDLLGGNDTVIASGGQDTVFGGDGFDTADYSGMGSAIAAGFGSYDPADAVQVSTGWDPANPDASELKDLLYGVEHIIGTAYGDLIYFGYPVASNDLLLEGGAGDDAVVGSVANDTIDGGTGNDWLSGSLGDDFIYTGSGVDYIEVWQSTDSGTGAVTGDGYDVIADFDPLQDSLGVQYDLGANYDPFTDLTQTAEGALLAYADDSSVLLLGVDVAELNAENLFAFENQNVWYY